MNPGRLQSLVAVLVGVALASAAQIIMKRGLTAVGAIELGSGMFSKLARVAVHPAVLFGLFLYGLSSVFYLFALTREDLSFAYPILALNFVLIALLSKIVLHETIGGFRMAGIMVVVLGVTMIVTKS